MFLLKTEEELLQAFRPRDRQVVEPPAAVKFPKFVQDYYAWLDPTGVRVYLVFKDPVTQRPLGIAFRRDGSGGGGEGVGSLMCDWCHSFGSSDEIGLLTADRSSKKRVGVGLCRDLRCGEKLEQAADRAGRSAREPLERLRGKMERFAREALGIEFVPGA